MTKPPSMMSHKMSDLLAILRLLKTHFTRFSYHLGIHKPRKSTNSFKAIRSNSDSVHLRTPISNRPMPVMNV